MSMRHGLAKGLLGGGLATLLLFAPVTALLAETPPATNPAPPATVTKPVAKAADKQVAPAHPTKVAAKPKQLDKKVTGAKSKSAPKLAAKKSAPVKQATTPSAAPSYTVTTTRGHVTTTRLVTVPPPAAPVEKAQMITPKPVTPPVDVKAPAPPTTQVAATTTPPPLTPPDGAAPAAQAQAAATTPAAAFVSAFLGKAFGIARDNNMTPLQRRALLADLFANRMDVSRIAGLTTSDKLTGEPTDFQRRFKTILISYLVETYYPRIEQAADPSIKVDVTAASSLPDGTAVVWTTFTKSDWVSQSVKWHLVPEDGGFKIADIYSAGASLVQMERDTFISVMRDGGLPQLMAKLDARTKALASAAP
jgi:ABC-type transporter MlaC component